MSTDHRRSVDQLLTDTSVKYRPTIDQLSAKCRRNVGVMSAKCRRKVVEVLVNEKLYRPRHIWNDYRPCLDRVSTHYRRLYRPTVDRASTEYRPSVDRVSTECRPSMDRLSTECRPTIDRVSTAISTDISVDITHSKQDPTKLGIDCSFKFTHCVDARLSVPPNVSFTCNVLVS